MLGALQILQTVVLKLALAVAEDLLKVDPECLQALIVHYFRRTVDTRGRIRFEGRKRTNAQTNSNPVQRSRCAGLHFSIIQFNLLCWAGQCFWVLVFSLFFFNISIIIIIILRVLQLLDVYQS